MAKKRNFRKKVDQDVDYIDDAVVVDKKNSLFENKQLLFISVFGLLLLLVGVFLAYRMLIKAPKEKNAMEQMYRAQRQFAQDSFALALQNPGAGYDGFLGIIDNYGGTKAANLSHYYSGISYLNLGKYDAAIEYLKDFRATDAVTPITKNGAIGDAYSELNDFESALSFYRKAISSGDNDALTPYYMKKLGLLLRKQGQADEASKVFAQIKEKYPESTEVPMAERYMN